MIYMHAYQLLPDCLQKERCHNGRIHAAGQGKKDFPVAYLALHQFYLVSDKVLHIPVWLCLALVEYEFLKGSLIRKRVQFLYAFGCWMVNCHHRISQIIECGTYIHRCSVYDTVLSSVQDDSLHIIQPV